MSRIQLSPDQLVKYIKWQQVEVHQNLNDLTQRWWVQLKDMGMENPTGILIAQFIGFGLAIQASSYNVNKPTAMQDCSESYDEVIDGLSAQSKEKRN